MRADEIILGLDGLLCWAAHLEKHQILIIGSCSPYITRGSIFHRETDVSHSSLNKRTNPLTLQTLLQRESSDGWGENPILIKIPPKQLHIRKITKKKM